MILITGNKLFRIHDFEFRLCHLLIICVLIISFSVSVLIRCQPAAYGFELNEYDPFFDYRATKYLLDHGLDAYVNWHDDMSWYPQGRDIFKTSQVALHFTAAILYKIFGNGLSLYDFTIFFPVVIGSLTTIVIFALVRVIGGTTSGLFASLFFAVSPIIILRGSIGWFKSEPLGLFYGLLAVYLFLSGLKSQNHRVGSAKMISSGIILAIGFSAWGGVQFFILPLGLFIVTLSFIRRDYGFLIKNISLFVGAAMIVSFAFTRPGTTFLVGLGGFALMGSTIFLAIMSLVQKFSTDTTRLRNCVAFLAASLISGFIIISSNILRLPPSARYLEALNPFYARNDPVLSTIAEHQVPSFFSIVPFLSILIPFAALGVWRILRNGRDTKSYSHISINNEMMIFALIIGIVGAYAGSTLIRLELFSSLSVTILSSIGLGAMTSQILKMGNKFLEKRSSGFGETKITRALYVLIIVCLLIIPLVFPIHHNWITVASYPPTILNGGSDILVSSTDWLESMKWIKDNTPKSTVIAAWWDYGYWITTLSERKTLADNAAFPRPIIPQMAHMFLDSPEQGYSTLRQLHADYVVVFVAGQRHSDNNGGEFYILGDGGDLSKIWAMVKTEQGNSTKFLDSSSTPTPYFWQNTFLGKLIPFTPSGYLDFSDGKRSPYYKMGYNLVYTKTIKYYNDSGPLNLVYSSPSFNEKESGPVLGVLVYQVNQNYVKSNNTAP